MTRAKNNMNFPERPYHDKHEYGTIKFSFPEKKLNYYLFKVAKYILHHVYQYDSLKCSFFLLFKMMSKIVYVNILTPRQYPDPLSFICSLV